MVENMCASGYWLKIVFIFLKKRKKKKKKRSCCPASPRVSEWWEEQPRLREATPCSVSVKVAWFSQVFAAANTDCLLRLWCMISDKPPTHHYFIRISSNACNIVPPFIRHVLLPFQHKIQININIKCESKSGILCSLCLQ